MKPEYSHLSDEQLLLDVDGELSTQDEKLVRAHLKTCSQCRARQKEFEDAIRGFVKSREQESVVDIPSASGPRALLKARLRQISENQPEGPWNRVALGRLFASAAIGASLLLGFLMVRGSRLDHQATAAVYSLPDSSLTPGATVLLNRQGVCAQASLNNKAVPVGLRRKVFEEYRIDGADPRAYEVDYLITPALGGADDIRNLWPHSYSATVWNARIKDALENHLRGLVCGGQLDLSEAQREIATNWIAAYKKYFHTDTPLSEHQREDE